MKHKQNTYHMVTLNEFKKYYTDKIVEMMVENGLTNTEMQYFTKTSNRTVNIITKEEARGIKVETVYNAYKNLKKAIMEGKHK